MAKLTKRAESLFPWRDAADKAPTTMRMIASYAAQNPGLEYCNYSRGWSDTEGRAAYFAEARRITRQLHKVSRALHDAYFAGATDADIAEAARHAFSGRLSITQSPGGAWILSYCTGQYWCTEYRAACAAVLERAARIASERSNA